ncbi:hypothetical protein EF294_03770 [Gordonia oryzae]|uniref:Uncharacterized protein n=1 Tax=Gordonia oryzae TaxID=2487349 RepID=A0A3N4GU64_9ACTN|nr:hypothetical protein EF294_03770 [Gordonia oryzae]
MEQGTAVVVGDGRRQPPDRRPDAADEAIRAALERVGLAQRVEQLPPGLDTAIAATTLLRVEQ